MELPFDYVEEARPVAAFPVEGQDVLAWLETIRPGGFEPPSEHALGSEGLAMCFYDGRLEHMPSPSTVPAWSDRVVGVAIPGEKALWVLWGGPKGDIPVVDPREIDAPA